MSTHATAAELNSGTILEAARVYSRVKFRCTHLLPGTKAPCHPEWQRTATYDLGYLSSWFDGRESNIGLVLGDEYVALDVDKKSGGLETLALLEAEFGPLPRTPTQETGGGGKHYIFLAPHLDGVTLKKRIGFLPGLDFLCHNAMIVLTPSVHSSGKKYQWVPGLAPEEVEFSPLPLWLLKLVIQPTDSGRAGVTGIKEGGRNTALFRAGASLRGKGAEEEQLSVELTVLNATFDPPLDAGEVEGVIRSVLNYPAGRPFYTMNDAGLALRFVDEYGTDLQFLSDKGEWALWSETHWRRDDRGQIVQTFLSMVDHMRREADEIIALGDEPSSARRKQAAQKWASRAGDNARLNAALKIASTDSRVATVSTEFDRQPGFLPVKNGVIDLTTGQLLPHSRERRFTKIVPVAYDRDAKAPLWTAVIERALPGELNRFLQTFLGYSLHGAPVLQKFVIWQGRGADSKSTIASIVARALGPFVVRTPAATFLAADHNESGGSPRADLVALQGARLILANETPSHRKLDAQVVKSISGGDPTTTRGVYQRDMVSFDVTGTVVMPTNPLPGGDEADDALWRRLLLLHFGFPVPPNEQDPHLVEKIASTELEGVLAWLIEGAVRYAKEGLMIPESMLERTRAWRKAVGTIERFVEDTCSPSPGAKLGLRETHVRYRTFCHMENTHPLGLENLRGRLTGLGYQVEGAGRVEVLVGLKFCPRV